MRHLALFIGLCVAMVAAVVAVVWAAGGFGGLGLSGHGLAALIIGAAFTVLLTVVLMGLVFYSNRSEHDRRVQDTDRRDDTN
ncbi:MAG: hypothetical protein ACREEE_00570 [Dongiaceae bacterium]